MGRARRPAFLLPGSIPREGVPGVRVDYGQREAGLLREPSGVGVLRGEDEVLPVQATDLDPAPPVGQLDLDDAPFGDAAPDAEVPHAQSAGLAHEEPRHALSGAGLDERADLVGSAAAFHYYGLEPGVEGSGREEALDRRSEELPRRVVHVRFEELDFSRR